MALTVVTAVTCQRHQSCLLPTSRPYCSFGGTNKPKPESWKRKTRKHKNKKSYCLCADSKALSLCYNFPQPTVQKQLLPGHKTGSLVNDIPDLWRRVNNPYHGLGGSGFLLWCCFFFNWLWKQKKRSSNSWFGLGYHKPASSISPRHSWQ